MNISQLKKSLNPSYRKHNPVKEEINNFIRHLHLCIDTIKFSDEQNESEEHIKEPIRNFLKNSFYKDNLINTRENIDLAIYLGKKADSNVGVLIETKKPSNRTEFPSLKNINKKALHELLLYYLKERVDGKNNNIKHLIATNGYEWFLFKAEDFYNFFYKNKRLIKEYEAFRDGLKDTSKNELFYNEIATKYIKEVEDKLPYLHIDFNQLKLDNLSDGNLKTLYKIFSNVHLLGHSFGNDGNKLNKSFYNELLHIIGLEEITVKGKKLITRKGLKNRDYASLIENTIFNLEERDYLNKAQGFKNENDKAFNVALQLSLTWINRILFLKLLESQLQNYHHKSEEHKFLNSGFIEGFDGLNDLFFSALAKKPIDRHPKFKNKYQYIPYLNSSLFERNKLEKETFEISTLKDEKMKVYGKTVLKDNKEKRLKGKLDTLTYLFKFLDAYDFSTHGKEESTDKHESKTLINASVLGLIFEKINGYKEGSFYTPAYITMYMCGETLRQAVIQKFRENENPEIKDFFELKTYCRRFFKAEDTTRFNDLVNSLKICDPAVGSGHFLVSALNEIILIKNELGILNDFEGFPLQVEMQIDNDELYILNKEGDPFEYKPKNKESLKIQKALFHEKQILIENCLFGVDINPNSVKICRLRLWIELLKNAYYTEENQLQTLPNIDINIKTGNSLISRFDLKNDLKAAFRGKNVNYSFRDYKNAVSEYKNSNSKKQKEEILEIINEVKGNFQSTFNQKFIDQVNQKKEAYNLKREQLNNLRKFGEKINKEDLSVLNDLKSKAEKAYLEKEEIVNNIIFKDAFEWRFEFPEVLDDKGNYVGFDVVIGNPPYMRVQEITKTQPQEKKYYEENYSVARSSYDLANIFFELAVKISNSGSHNAYIFPHKFFNSASTSSFRNYLIEGKYIDKLTHFGANMIFEEADTYTCIANFSSTPNCGFLIYRADYKDDFKEKLFNPENYSLITYDQINELSELYGSDQWILPEGQMGVKIFNKLYSSQITLKSLLNGIYQGIATSKDDLYIGKLIRETPETYILDFENLNKKFEVEKDYFKPILRGKDVKRYAKLSTDLYVFFPYNLQPNPIKPVNLKDFEENFPLTYKYISDNENLFKSRERGKAAKMEAWYAYIYPKNLDKFESFKLSSMEICSKYPNVTLNPNIYHNTKVYSWVKKETTQESYEYLLSLANSKVMWWFLKTTGDTLQGDARTFKTNYLNPFPLPPRPMPKIENEIKEMVKEILKLKNQNSDVDTFQIEKELDQIIYNLYMLSNDEIEIIENA